MLHILFIFWLSWKTSLWVDHHHKGGSRKVTETAVSLYQPEADPGGGLEGVDPHHHLHPPLQPLFFFSNLPFPWAQLRRLTSPVPYQTHFRTGGRIKRQALPPWDFALPNWNVSKKTGLDAIPLPNNYVQLGATPRYAVWTEPYWSFLKLSVDIYFTSIFGTIVFHKILEPPLIRCRLC